MCGSKNSNTNQYLDRRQEDPSEDESAESDDKEDNKEDNKERIKEEKAQEGAVGKATQSEFIFRHYSDSLLSYPFQKTLKSCMQIILGLSGKRREKPLPYI